MREIGWLQLSSNGEKGNSQHSKNSSEFFSPNHPFPFSPSYILGDRSCIGLPEATENLLVCPQKLSGCLFFSELLSSLRT